MKRWMTGAIILALLAPASLSAQEGTAEPATEEEQPAKAKLRPVDLEPDKPKFVPILRERKMTPEELFAYERGWLSSEAPAYAMAGERSSAPGQTRWVSDALGYKIDAETLAALDSAAIEEFLEKREANIETLRERMEASLIELRRAAESDFDARDPSREEYDQIRRDLAALDNEIANVEAAYTELALFEELGTLADMRNRLKRALVHVQEMQSARSAREFDQAASVLATAFGIIEQQREELASARSR